MRARGNAGADGNGGSISLRFDCKRDFGGCGQFFRQFFDLLLRAFKVFWGCFCLQRRGFGLFGNLGRQNVRSFIGRALFNGCCIVGFDWGKRFRTLGIGSRFCRRELCWAVLNDDAGQVECDEASA